MAYPYKVKAKKVNLTGATQHKFFATPVHKGLINSNDLAEEIEMSSSLTKSDVFAAIAALTSFIDVKLRDGYSVKLDGLGTFSLSITSEGFNDATECTPHCVKAKKVCFRADKKIKKSIQDTKFEKSNIIFPQSSKIISNS